MGYPIKPGMLMTRHERMEEEGKNRNQDVTNVRIYPWIQWYYTVT